MSPCLTPTFRSCRLAVTASLVLLSTSPLHAQARATPAVRWADSVSRLIDRATIAGDSAALGEALRLTDRVLRAMPDDGLLLHYRGYASYRLAQHRAPGAPRDSVLEDALAWLDKSSPLLRLPETEALRVSVMGQLMAGGVMRGMRYGAASSRAESAALSGAPNPRALLLVAISTWFKPSMFGGGHDKARVLLDRAIAAFANDRPRDGHPAWGAAEAHAWRGIMEQEGGRKDSARAAFEQALAIAPDYRWVRNSLLPSVR